MHVHCHVAWGHVTTLGAFDFVQKGGLEWKTTLRVFAAACLALWCNC